MKFVIIKTIERVKDYQVSFSNLMYSNFKSDLIFNGNLIEKNIESYFCFKNIIGYHDNSDTVIVDSKGKNNIRLDVVFRPENLFENTFTTSKNFFKDEKGNWKSDLFLYQLNPFKEIKKFERNIEGGLIRLKDGFIQKSKNLIIFLDKNTARPLWQYDISPLGTYLSLTNEVRPYEVKRFIGIHERQFIVQLSNATFLFLDSETGKQNKIIHLNTEYPLPSPVFYEDASTAHIIGDSLVWLSNQRLIQIDLKTYAVKIVKDYFNAPREEQFRFMSNSHHKGLLYFVADKGWQYVTPTHVGLMNPETGEVLWHEQLQDTGGLREAPQATDDKLYIRTNKGVLHIFERSI